MRSKLKGMSHSTVDSMSNLSILRLHFPETEVTLEITSDSTYFFNDVDYNLPDYVDSVENVKIITEINELSGAVPIELYTGGNPDFSPILLLEETEYELLLKGQVDFEFPYLKDNSGDIAIHKMRLNGFEDYSIFTLNFGGYVGKGWFDVIIAARRYSIPIEVRSKKISYLSDYPLMLADISEFSSSLLLSVNSPLYREYELSTKDNDALYGDFILLEYIFSKRHILDLYSVLKTKLRCNMSPNLSIIPAGVSGDIDPAHILDIIAADNLIVMKDGPISGRFAPVNVPEYIFEEDYDTPENRMVKDLFFTLQNICIRIHNNLIKNTSTFVFNRIMYMISELEAICSESWFKSVGDLTIVPFESTILQKDENYSSLFGIYQMLTMGIMLRQNDLDDVLQAQNTPIYQVYEYCCYTRLYRTLRKLSINKPELVYDKDSGNRWTVTIRRNSGIEFIIPAHSGNLKVSLYYNQTFINKDCDFSSYSIVLRPDFTLVFSKDDQVRIVSFDAKYKAKIKNYEETPVSDYWESDICKMHTYRDALLRNIGSYILYPGTSKTIFPKPHCHEDWLRLDDLVIPSVGAIPLIPGSDDDIELEDVLKLIIEEISSNISS